MACGPPTSPSSSSSSRPSCAGCRWTIGPGSTTPTLASSSTKLVSTEGVQLRVLRVWPSEPLLPEQRWQLAVVAEATAEQLRGTFLLRLGEANGPRTITVRGVTFP
ncbi:hypothetical protein DAT35_34850 [Vitiosangium sp. GDMCC 1.1324]|nr:hypothetical protein DAT35_34850 [Vitiosangium sp. GDMCC 1.1324]